MWRKTIGGVEMKNGFKFYIVFWFVLVIVFNVISFVSVGWEGQEKYTYGFWFGYGFIMFSFLLNIILVYTAFHKKDLKKLFYNIPFLRMSYTCLIVAFVVGAIFMLIPNIPYWVCILVAVIVMGFDAVSLIKAKATANIVYETDKKVTKQTQFMKLLTADAQSLMSIAKEEETRLLTQKVYETVRYSDPVSHELLEGDEKQIQIEFNKFAAAVRSGSEDVGTLAKGVIYLVNNRNENCKALK